MRNAMLTQNVSMVIANVEQAGLGMDMNASKVCEILISPTSFFFKA